MRRYILGIALLTAWPSSGLASLTSPQDLGQLSSDATAIVVATEAERDAQALSLFVSRVLKGSLAPGSHIATWPGAPTEGTEVLHGAALWFLVGSESDWEVLPAYTGQPSSLDSVAIPIPDGELSPEEGYAETDPIEDKLVVELRRGLLSGDSDLASTASLALESSMEARDPLTRERYHEHQLGVFPGHPEHCALIDLKRDWAVTLATVAQDLLSRGETVGAGVLIGIDSISDPAAATRVQALLQGAQGDAFLKQASANALRNIHTPQTLPSLVGLLAESDPELQYIGVMGLSSFAFGCPPGPRCAPPPGGGPYTTPAVRLRSPSQQLFLQDPALYISFWQTWWNEQQVPPLVVISGGGECHPNCSVVFTASATSLTPVTYSWSGCCSGDGTSATCAVTAHGTQTCTVTATNFSGSASASAGATGTNARSCIEVTPCEGHGGGQVLDIVAWDEDGDNVTVSWGTNPSDCRMTCSRTICDGAPTCHETCQAKQPVGGYTTCSYTLKVEDGFQQRTVPFTLHVN
jgi:hypothetical protein